MNKNRLSITPACEAVLQGALTGAPVADYTDIAVSKCYTKGWIQFEGDAGEKLALTANGRKACELVGIK